MFEWLEQEIAAIKTPRFHLIDGPADAKLREAVARTPARLSSRTYTKFRFSSLVTPSYIAGGCDDQLSGSAYLLVALEASILADGKVDSIISGFTTARSVYVKQITNPDEQPILNPR